MSHPLTVVVGPARCGKTHYLAEEYRQVLQSAGAAVGRALWLSPTSRGAAAVREQLLTGRRRVAVLDPGVTTFDLLARRILGSMPNPPRATSPLQERRLLGQVIDAAVRKKRLQYLAAMGRRSSFIDLVLEHVQELKRYGVTPAAFARSVGHRGDARQQKELADLYAEYEKLLARHQLADEEGRHLAACEALEKDASLYGQLDLVVADGFTDFTFPQLRLLEQFAARCGRLLISLPGEEERSAGRSDLFAKTCDTIRELQLHFPKLQVDYLDCRSTDWPALDHISHHLFQHPRDIPAPSSSVEQSLDRVQIVAAAGVHDEIVTLAREIKRRLTSVLAPIAAGEIVVVFRNLHDAAPRIRETFDEFGIPYSLEAARPLASTTVMRLLLDLLRLDHEDWPFRRVVSIVTNNQLAFAERQQRAAAEWLLRDLQIDRGREQLVERVTKLQQLLSGEEPPAEGTHLRSQAEAAQHAEPLLAQLAAAIDGLPAEGGATDWIAAIEQFATALRLRCFAPGSASLEDHTAWRTIAEHLERLAQLSAWQDEPPQQLSRSDLLEILFDLAERETLPRESDDTGRVRVLSAQTARTITAKHVFLAGMSEQAFPSPERVGSFYSAADYRFFAAAANQMRAAAELPSLTRSQEEMMLFYEVLTRSSERLTISYPALDEKAQALPPSPYVTEVERAVAPLTIGHTRAMKPAPIPTGESPLGPRDWRVQAVHEGLERKDPALLAGMLRNNQPAATGLESALRIIAARSRRDAFGPAEGLLESPAVRARLARRFGSGHLWSPSQWETYAACPYRFFIAHVLRLQPLGELVLQTDRLRRGMLVHRVLAEFHRRAPELLGSAAQLSRHDLAKFVSEFVNLVDALTRSTPYSGIEAALVELDRLQIARWAPRYYAEHGKYDAAWSLDAPLEPTYLEWRFGPPRAGEKEFEDPRSTDEPLVLTFGKEQIRITGRIDRIDVGQSSGGAVFNVLDYKSGKRPTLSKERVASGEHLQPALYVMAAQALLFSNESATPLYAGYWSLVNGITVAPAYSLHCSQDLRSESEDWGDLRKSVVELIGRFVDDIRQGNFPVASRDEYCTSRCDFATVCRISQVRSLGKQWFAEEDDAPATQPEVAP